MMDAYIYQAAMWCADCAKDIQAEILKCDVDCPETRKRGDSDDSDDFPQGPYDGGGGEADSPQHCDGCGVFLENPLTGDGVNYLMDSVIEALDSGRISDALEDWIYFYDLNMHTLLRYSADKARDGKA